MNQKLNSVNKVYCISALILFVAFTLYIRYSGFMSIGSDLHEEWNYTDWPTSFLMGLLAGLFFAIPIQCYVNTLKLETGNRILKYFAVPIVLIITALITYFIEWN